MRPGILTVSALIVTLLFAACKKPEEPILIEYRETVSAFKTAIGLKDFTEIKALSQKLEELGAKIMELKLSQDELLELERILEELFPKPY